MVPPGELAARVKFYAKDSLLLVYEDDSAPRVGATLTRKLLLTLPCTSLAAHCALF